MADVSGLPHHPITWCNRPKGVGLSSRHRLRFTRREALSTVGRNGPVDDGAAVDTFPGIKNEKEI